MEFKFSVGAKIKEAWNLYKENLGNIILFLVVAFIFQVIINSFFSSNLNVLTVPDLMKSLPSFIVFNLISFFSSLLIYYIWIRSTLDALDGKGFHPFSKETLAFTSFWNYLKTNILYGLIFFIPILIIGIGLVFLFHLTNVVVVSLIAVILGILFVVVAIRLLPATYLSIDKNQGARENIKEAWTMTKNCDLTIFVSLFLITLFMFLGILALFIGFIVTYPIGLIVITMLYRELVKFRYGGTQAPEIPLVKDIPQVEEKTEVISENKVEDVK